MEPPAPEAPDAPEVTAAPMGLAERRHQAEHAGSAVAVERQHDRGKLTARERLDVLLDPGSFVETDLLARHRAFDAGLDERPYTDGVVTGWGRVDGRRVCVFSQDFTVFGGSLGEVNASKIHKVMDLALRTGVPCIGINDGAGARIQEGVAALTGYGEIFVRNARASGLIPQISVIMGPCAGGAVYSPALTDFVFMVEGTSYMFITGPDVVRAVTGEDVTVDELGGARSHATRSGVAHFTAADDTACLAEVRRLLSFLPANAGESPPRAAASSGAAAPGAEVDPGALLPTSPGDPYDVRSVVRAIVDDGDLLEYSPAWARNLVCGFTRLGGAPVGIVANQPDVLAGVLDIDSCEKGARFVRTCDAFNVPIITFVDVPGFLPGTDQEHGGIIRRGAKLLYAFCEASVPRVQVVLRKAYGGAYVVMGSKALGADLAFAWPTAEMVVMSPEAAVEVLHHRELDASDDRDGRRARLVAEYAEELANPWLAAERGYVDDVIEPSATRATLVEGLALLATVERRPPRRKHGNVPL